MFGYHGAARPFTFRTSRYRNTSSSPLAARPAGVVQYDNLVGTNDVRYLATPDGLRYDVLVEPGNDPAGLAAGRNTRSYLIQSYARDMGGGNMVMMREIDVPVRVRGRHWGGFRTAYKL